MRLAISSIRRVFSRGQRAADLSDAYYREASIAAMVRHATPREEPFVRVPVDAYERVMASHLQRKLNRTAKANRRMVELLARQKSQTADDQHYIDLLEARLSPALLVAAREEAAAFRRGAQAAKQPSTAAESESLGSVSGGG